MSLNRLNTDQLPYALYRAEQVRELDRLAIEQFGIPGRTLMERAGEAAFRLLQSRWPEARDITVLCGTGNNGGDGYVVARLALQQGYAVRVLQLGDADRLSGDALTCARVYTEAGGEVYHYQGIPKKSDLIVDAMLGTGLEREVSGAWADAVRAVNDYPVPVLALDIPSGIHSDNGRVMGCAVHADETISFIGLKRGLYTGDAPAYTGTIHFDALEAPAAIYASQLLAARRIDWQKQKANLTPRLRTAHKGHFGHCLVVGGNHGFIGAAALAGVAAARTGAGLVSIATRAAHATALSGRYPHLMVHGVETETELRALLDGIDVVAIGPGLGQDEWARRLFGCVLDCAKPLVVDADALNLLAAEPDCQPHWVLTPHPGEAARLLGCTIQEIQRDRFDAVERLQAGYGGVVLLKGAGTLVQGGGHQPVGVCSGGNPGMASGGMGDLLSGIIAALIAQGLDNALAAEMGVCLHAEAGDRAAEQGERGMIPTDLLTHLRPLINRQA